jgi:hypothetical protein
MARKAVEHLFTGSTTPYTAYDSTKTTLGKWIQQKTGAATTDKYAGPFPVTVARPMEQSSSIAAVYPCAINIGNNIHWVFLADNGGAAPTRRIVLYTYNTATQVWSWRGFVNLTYPSTTNHTIRGFGVVRHLYTTGTAAVSGTNVTGTGTAWQTAQYAVGARIGFGSTNPNNITTWYHITNMASDTSLTLLENAGTIANGPYVIEELRVYTSNSNMTATNGGLFVAKGVNFDDFTVGGTTIAAATTTDNQKAVYWLADASTVSNTNASGLGIESSYSDTSHNIYVTNSEAGGTLLRIYKYNGRASLSNLSAGKSTSAFILKTGTQTIAGLVQQLNSCRCATLNHGPGSGVECLYAVTTTRVLRIPLSSIIDASTTFIADSMNEIPPGSVNSFPATSALSAVDYISQIDRLLVMTTSNARSYITRYQVAGNQFDRVFSSNTYQLDQSAADLGISPYPHAAGTLSVWSEDGVCYFARISQQVANNQIYAVPMEMDWNWAASNDCGRLITPSISTPGCTKFIRVLTMYKQLYGSDSFGIQPEPYRVYARTSGISDNSGSWTLLDDLGDLSSFGAANEIQFMYEFRIAGVTMLPARIYGLNVIYEDSSTDSHYQPSVTHSSASAKRFAWRFATAFGGTVPTLTVKLYDAETGTLLLTDTTVAQAYGTFEKTTNNGGVWGSYNTMDKGNEDTYIRYTPNSLGDNIKVRALLTQ